MDTTNVNPGLKIGKSKMAIIDYSLVALGTIGVLCFVILRDPTGRLFWPSVSIVLLIGLLWVSWDRVQPYGWKFFLHIIVAIVSTASSTLLVAGTLVNQISRVAVPPCLGNYGEFNACTNGINLLLIPIAVFIATLIWSFKTSPRSFLRWLSIQTLIIVIPALFLLSATSYGK